MTTQPGKLSNWLARCRHVLRWAVSRTYRNRFVSRRTLAKFVTPPAPGWVFVRDVGWVPPEHPIAREVW